MRCLYPLASYLARRLFITMSQTACRRKD